MGYLLEYKPCDGYTEIMKRGEYGLGYITFGILRLGSGEKFAENSDSNEIGLVILTGKCSVKVGKYDYKSVGNRASVFGGKAYGIYIPPNTDYEVVGEDKVEIALCKAPADLKAEPVLVTPDQVNIRTVGQHNWRRYVHDIIDARITASKLVIGETFNPPGNWSSYPPHRHDYDNLPDESEQEELYFFKVEPPQGFGIQRIYTDDLSVNKVYVVQNNSVVAIPKGYHPVSAAPGYQLYYLWVLAGEKRILKPKDDPAHSWVRACEAVLDTRY